MSGEHGAFTHHLEAGLDTNSYRIDNTKEFGGEAREQEDDATSLSANCATHRQ